MTPMLEEAPTESVLIPAWENGALRPIDKLEVHRRGLRHPAISVFVLKGEKILLQRRALSKYHTPGLWANACCTHPNWGEPAEIAAARRLREELGAEGLSLRSRGRIEYRAAVGDGLIEHEHVDVFLAEAPPDLSLSPDPAEVMDTRWTPRQALAAEIAAEPDRFTPWLRIYMAEHAQQIFDDR